MVLRIPVLMLLWLTAGLVLQAATAPAAPSWPQAFTLTSGDHQTYGIPVTSPGRVTVSVTWQGAPLALTLKDQQGTVLARTDAHTPSALLEYTATATDLQRGPIWSVTVSTPAAGKSTTLRIETVPPVVATGTVSATYPAIDGPRLAAAMTTLQQQHTTAFATLLRRPLGQPTSIYPPNAPVVENRQLKLDALERTLTSKYALASGAPLGKPTTVGPARLNTEPAILSITPANGSPGDTVTVACLFVPTTPGGVYVNFNYGSGTRDVVTTPVETPTIDMASNTVYLKVNIPNALVRPADTIPAKVTLTVLNQQNNSVTTKPVNFQYDPNPTPVIGSVLPSAVWDGSSIEIRGDRFQASDKIFLTIPGQGDVPMLTPRMQYTTLFYASVPKYAASEALTGQVFVVNAAGKRSASFPITLSANQLAVTAVDRKQGEPGETLLITGKLLKNARVTLTAKPKAQQPATTAYISEASVYGSNAKRNLTVVQSSDNALLVRIPDNMEGFSGPLLADLCVDGVGDPVVLPFTLHPMYISIYFCDGSIDERFERHEGDDSWVNLAFDPVNYGTAWVKVNRSAGFFIGHRDDDTFTSLDRTILTEYGWKFDRAHVLSFSVDGLASVASAGLTADNRPTVTVHWYADASWNFVMYYPSIILRGPKGVPFARIGTTNNTIMPSLSHLVK